MQQDDKSVTNDTQKSNLRSFKIKQLCKLNVKLMLKKKHSRFNYKVSLFKLQLKSAYKMNATFLWLFDWGLAYF